ncbi:hypothetical protein C8A00DRAFT_35546 [Chaetomidium leptoderma]|uniref:Uncharacterized protein n=1 Tax=Chaetomidium leptoderma TaxID=669021 RepID=A0AAN6VJZ4_9PEZI|nr:hypothetical protein C8A00DRAFT_35546 [Chaetomidium leptoderma]
MRDTILTSLFLASATLTSASRLECLHTRSRELAVAASCGDEGSLNYCFSQIPVPTQPEALSPELEHCLVSAGCTPAESQIEALWVLKQCDNPSSDLRRGRRQTSLEESDDDASPPAAAAAAAAKDPMIGARNPLPAITAAMHLPRQDNTPGATTTPAAAAAAAADADQLTSPSPCFTDVTTDTTTCPVQTTGPDAGKKLPCFPTVLTSARCRDGLICQFDSQGSPSCMFNHSTPPIEGIIIAAVFASAVALGVCSICFLCCRERRAHRRTERAAEAARIAKEAKTQATVAAKRPGVSITGGVSGSAVEGQPLMYQGGGGGGASSPGPQQQHFPQQGQMPMQQQGYGAGNPFADAAHDGHPLR